MSSALSDRHLMKSGVALPEGWTQRNVTPFGEDEEIPGYEYEVNSQNTVLVWLGEHFSRSGTTMYHIEISTIEEIDGIRRIHDFDAESSEEFNDAERALREFLSLLTNRLSDTALSSETRLYLVIQDALTEFIGEEHIRFRSLMWKAIGIAARALRSYRR